MPEPNLIRYEMKLDLPASFMKKVKGDYRFKRLRAAKPGDNPDAWQCATLNDAELGQIYPASELLKGKFNTRVGSETEFVGVRYGICPHTDDSIDGKWSNFLILQSNGYRVASMPLNQTYQYHDKPGDLLALNIWKTHWVEPRANPHFALKPPYVWLGLTMQSNEPIPEYLLDTLFTAHLKKYIAESL